MRHMQRGTRIVGSIDTRWRLSIHHRHQAGERRAPDWKGRRGGSWAAGGVGAVILVLGDESVGG